MVQNRDNQWIRCTTLRFKCLNLFSTVNHLKITNAVYIVLEVTHHAPDWSDQFYLMANITYGWMRLA